MEKTYMDDIDRTIFPYVEYPGYPFRYPTHLPLVIEKKQADILRRVSARRSMRSSQRLSGVFSRRAMNFSMRWRSRRRCEGTFTKAMR